MELLIIIIYIALFSAFTIQLLRKIGLFEYVQVHGNDFFYQLSKCDFCLSFWHCLMLSIALVIYKQDFIYFIIPFFATPITKKFL